MVSSPHPAQKSDEMDMADSGPLAERYPNQWAVLADKGYQGTGEFCRIIHPKRKPHGSFLSPADVSTNKFISSDRILAENYFGRICELWNVLGSKWKWSEINYDPIFRLCLGLTNFHIRWKPLRDEDMQLYQQPTSRWYHIGNSQLKRRGRTQKRYRQRRADFVQLQFRAEGVRELFGRQPKHVGTEERYCTILKVSFLHSVFMHFCIGC